MINKVREGVRQILDHDNSGHGMDHTERVVTIAKKIAMREGGSMDVVEMTALLHDVDDHKAFGREHAKNLINAHRILDEAGVPENLKEQVIGAIHTIGYSKRLQGIVPETIEAKTVSDADMLDGIGASGILRSHQYNLNKGNKFFDKDIWPVTDISADAYMAQKQGTVVTHMFEKLFKLKDEMLTETGTEMAQSRHDSMVAFLYAYFEEQNVPEWTEYMDNYLAERDDFVKSVKQMSSPDNDLQP